MTTTTLLIRICTLNLGTLPGDQDRFWQLAPEQSVTKKQQLLMTYSLCVSRPYPLNPQSGGTQMSLTPPEGHPRLIKEKTTDFQNECELHIVRLNYVLCILKYCMLRELYAGFRTRGAWRKKKRYGEIIIFNIQFY